MGTKSKIKFKVDLKNRKQIITGILLLITIIGVILTAREFFNLRKDLEVGDFASNQELYEQIHLDVENVIIPQIIYEESQKDKAGYLQKIKEEKESKISKIANTKILSLGKIRNEKAKELRYYCEKYSLEIPEVEGNNFTTFDHFDSQPSYVKVEWYTDFINSFGEKTKEQQKTYDDILNKYNPIEKAEIDKLNAQEAKAEEVRAYKEKIAMSSEAPKVKDIGYSYKIFDKNKKEIVKSSYKDTDYPGHDNLVSVYARDSKGQLRMSGNELDSKTMTMIKDFCGDIGNVKIMIELNWVKDSANPLNTIYENTKLNINYFYFAWKIIGAIAIFALGILGLKFYEKKIFISYRKIKIEYWILIAIVAFCIITRIKYTNFYYVFLSIDRYNITASLIISLIAMFTVSDIMYLTDNGWGIFTKERFGLLRNLNSNEFIKNAKTSLRKSQKLKLTIFIVASLIYNLIAFKLCYRYVGGLYGIGQQMLFVYYIFLVIYLIYKLIFIAIEIKEIEKATQNIAKGQFNIKFKRTRTASLDNIRKNLSNIDKGFKIATEDEIKSERMKSELITNVSHDLKTPLTSIINYVDLLQRDNLSEDDKKEYLKILDNKSKRLKVLIEDLFEAAKASTGNIELNIEEINIVSVLRQTMGEFTEKIESEKLDFKVNIPDNKIILALDGARMWRVFENLISNALKYSLKGTRVYIDLRETDSEVVFEIKNVSGYELNCEVNELKERFKRADLSRNTEGSGLGLAIANGLVEIQGGKLDISIDGDLFKVRVSFKK